MLLVARSRGAVVSAALSERKVAGSIPTIGATFALSAHVRGQSLPCLATFTFTRPALPLLDQLKGRKSFSGLQFSTIGTEVGWTAGWTWAGARGAVAPRLGLQRGALLEDTSWLSVNINHNLASFATDHECVTISNTTSCPLTGVRVPAGKTLEARSISFVQQLISCR